VRAARRQVDEKYRAKLKSVEGVSCSPIPADVTPNYSYFPILVQPSFPISRDALYDRLKQAGIFARRYFYPLLTSFPMYSELPSSNARNLPVAREMAKRVLCLPIYPDLSEIDQNRVVDCIASVA
jgi:dTDP-4-amino-4,6-dideoxygalactose transaminase